jgi:uncharacterized SAM-binding protein YcdF (DUF218 family)
MDILASKIFGELLLLPPFNLSFVCLIGVLLVNRGYQLGSALICFSIVANIAIGLPLWGYLQGDDETSIAYQTPNFEGADAIVILGGGRRLYAPEYALGETVSSGTLERLRYGAKIATETGLPILVSGGKPSSGLTTGQYSEATLMAGVLEDEFSLPVNWIERESEDTLGNARFTAPILRLQGLSNIILVTHFSHMDRAKMAFESQDLKVIAAATGWPVPNAENLRVGHFVPSFAGYIKPRHLIYRWLVQQRVEILSTLHGGQRRKSVN